MWRGLAARDRCRAAAPPGGVRRADCRPDRVRVAGDCAAGQRGDRSLALAALAASFLIDIALAAGGRRLSLPCSAGRRSLRCALALVAAVALLNASLSFHNIWPTPFVRWTGELSIELAVVLIGLLAVGRLARRTVAPRAIAIAAAVWVMLVLGHYADVTAPALYGRDINLYWDCATCRTSRR